MNSGTVSWSASIILEQNKIPVYMMSPILNHLKTKDFSHFWSTLICDESIRALNTVDIWYTTTSSLQLELCLWFQFCFQPPIEIYIFVQLEIYPNKLYWHVATSPNSSWQNLSLSNWRRKNRKRPLLRNLIRYWSSGESNKLVKTMRMPRRSWSCWAAMNWSKKLYFLISDWMFVW